MRIPKSEYYLGIAEAVGKRSTCIRRQYGAVIVKNDEIISTGYNGSPRGEENCCDNGTCWREENGIPHGQMYEKCLDGETKIRLLNGTSPSIKELADSGDEFYAFAVDTDTGEIVPAKGKARSTGTRKDMCVVEFDDGTKLKCTVDHRIMLRNHSFKAAGELKYGDSVMPYYGDLDFISNTWRERETKPTSVEREEWRSTCKTSKAEIMYLVFKFFNQDFNMDVVSGKDSEYVLHHIDGNHQNNVPENLVLMKRGEHTTHHRLISGRSIPRDAAMRGLEAQRILLKTDPKFLARKKELGTKNMSALWNNQEWREKSVARCRENLRRGREKTNKDPAVIKRRCEGKVLAGISRLYFLCGRKDITAEEYPELREKFKVNELGRIPRVDNILRNFPTVEAALEQAKCYNHKVASVTFIDEEREVFDIEVPKYHNFAVDLGNNSGVFVHNCMSVHAEQNAIISAPREKMIGATLYLDGCENGRPIAAEPCEICRKMIKNAGIYEVVCSDGNGGHVRITV